MRGIYYITESLSVINLLVLDSEAFVFFRGFNKAEGASGQVIIRLDLLRCPELIRELVAFVKQHYISQYAAVSRASSGS